MRNRRLIDLVLAALFMALFAGAMAIGAHATDFPLSNRNFTQNTNFLVSTNATNLLYVEANTYHTIHLVGSTNGAGIVVDRTIDANSNPSNWVSFMTNTWATTNLLISETNLTGKWTYFRFRTVWTNGTYYIDYLGGK